MDRGNKEIMDVLTQSGDYSETIYQLKWLPWRGEFSPIVTQNANGPCPLLALCNVLLLGGKMHIAPGTTAISSHELLNNLATIMFEQMPQGLSEGDSLNYQQNVHDVIRVFPKLQTGLDVNVKFDGVKSFEFTSELAIFDLCGVELCHGWLPDPQDIDTYKVISCLSYNQLVEKSLEQSTSSTDIVQIQNTILCSDFLKQTANQLTYHGLCKLNATITDQQLCVFFRNNHFSTLYKHQGRLLLLVTDMGFLNEFGHVWETMEDISGDTHFVNATFEPHPLDHIPYQSNCNVLSQPTTLEVGKFDDGKQMMSDEEIALQLQQDEMTLQLQEDEMTLQQIEYQQHVPQDVNRVTITTMQQPPQSRGRQSNKVSVTTGHGNIIIPFSLQCILL